MNTEPAPANSPVSRRRWLPLLLAGAATAGVLAALLLTRSPAPPVLERATLLHTPRPLPAVALADHRGAAFGTAGLAGQWTLLFFGFTHCPDICPTTLATLAASSRQLAELPAAARPRIVLVTVDPARDTPAALAAYLGHFDPAFVGLTGSQEAVEELARGLGAVMQAQPANADGSYTVDHTAAIFLIDPDAAMRAVFGSPHEAGLIARDYRRIIAARR